MNAIILAAGMGTRLRPLTDARPKVLVEIAGESFFERQLRQLRAAGIREITVVTGYCAEAFAPWRKNDDLDFVHNEHFADRNNIWSMKLVGDKLGDTVVLDGDLRLADGIIPIHSPQASGWFVGWAGDMRNEWVVRSDETGRVRRIDVASGSGWILTGLSYWTAEGGRLIASLLEETIGSPDWEKLYWDDIPRRALDRIDARAWPLPEDGWAEIDSLEDKVALEARLRASHGPAAPARGGARDALDGLPGGP